MGTFSALTSKAYWIWNWNFGVITVIMRKISIKGLGFCLKPKKYYFRLNPGEREYQGIKKQGKGLQDFYADTALSVAILYFRTLVCVTTLVYYTAYLAPLALFPCRGVSRRTDKRAVCNRSFDRASWTTSLKTSLSDGPGCWDPEAQLLLSSSRRSETCGTEETGINEVSLSGAWEYN